MLNKKVSAITMLSKRIIAITMVSMLSIGIFAGCNKDTTSKDTNSTNTPKDAKVTYPIKTEGKVTLKWWVPIMPDAVKYITNYDENEAFQAIQEKTGVDIEFIHPAIGQEKEQFNLLVASGQYPDIMHAEFYNGGPDAGVEDGIFEDISGYLPIYAPDFYNIVAKDEDLYRLMSNNDGKISAFFLIKDIDPPSSRIAVRNDVLKDMGENIPKTLGDYDRLFGKMLKAGITPISLNPTGYERQFIGMFDTLPSFYNNGKDKILFGQIQPEFKKYLELMNSWYKAGYISKDFMSNKIDKVGSLFDNKQIGVLIHAVDLIYARATLQHYEFTPLPYPRLKEDQQLHHEATTVSKYNGQRTVISAKSKYKEVAVQLLNYMYTKEGAMLANWGVEGSAYTMVDGKPKFTDKVLNNEKIDMPAAQYIFKIHFAPKLSEPGVVCNPNVVKDAKTLEFRMMWADDPKVDNSYVLPPFQLNTKDNSRRATIMTEVNTYCDEMVLKFITGAEPLSNFDKFVDGVKSKGLDEAIQITQKAYDELMSKKLK